jgi:hypothetical protein
MESAETDAEVAHEKPQKIKRGIWPALALVFTAPLVAEFLLGDLPIKLLPALVALAPMYGGGALLIRETVRRSGRGWPSILLLGMAYAVLEEAFTTQSLFNPNYLKLNLGLLTPAYIPALGIGAWWTLWMFMVHGIWSISTPIALIEACVPDRARAPWLGRVGLVITAIVFLIGVTAMTLIGYRQDHYLASPAQFVGAAMVVLLLATAAFLVPRRRGDLGSGDGVSPWMLGALALAFGSAALIVPMGWGWGAVAALLGLDVAMLLAVLWARQFGWGLMQQLALGSGAALAYGWHAFLQHPAVGQVDASVRVGNAIFLIGAIGLIWFAAKRTKASLR